MDNNRDLLKAFDEGSIQQTASCTHQDSFALTESVNLYHHLASKQSVTNVRIPDQAEALDLDLEALMGRYRCTSARKVTQICMSYRSSYTVMCSRLSYFRRHRRSAME
jgi:hypothetical protein